ncbi:ABC transporter substrate-binding protein [Nakamurella lactea]|uniref:ABC transporter substrate-binding protein n=1 Tax=Nakamurella lactea TaxID=459515 RepID=UPI0004180DDF|nr:ABC transporter substrate-binding protein [Nakamurella lactea]
MRARVLAAASLALLLTVAGCSSGSQGSSTGSAGPTSSGAASGTAGGTGSDASSGATGSAGMGSGTSSGAASEPAGTPAGAVTIGLGADPGNLDPWSSLSQFNLMLALFSYDTIVSIDADGRPVPALAEKWEQDGDSWTFHLHQGITCSNGTPLTAKTVADNVNWAGDPKNKSPMAGLYLPAGATATASGDSTVTITLKSPSPFFLQGLYGFPIICSDDLSKRDALAAKTSGSGPYVLTEAVPNDHYTYTVRDGYTWGPAGATTAVAGMPKTVTIKVVANETTLANLLLKGDVNIGAVVGQDRTRLAKANLFKVDILSPAGEFFFNQKKGLPMEDENLRKALIAAIDLSELNKVFSSGNGVVPTQMQVMAITCPTESMSNLPAFDVEAAKSLLDQAGWKLGAGGVREKDGKPLSLTLMYDTGSPSIQAAAELAVARWKAVGIDVKATAGDVIGDALFGTATWDISWQGVGTLNPAQLIPFFTGPAPTEGNNFGHTDNSEYAELTAKAMKLPAEKGCSLWNQAEASLLSHVNLAPFSFSPQSFWGSGVTFRMTAGQITATSLRVAS